MKSIEKQVIQEIKSLEEKFANSTKVKGFDEISNRFETLVKRGVAQKRGNHLLSVSDAHIKQQVWFNVK